MTDTSIIPTDLVATVQTSWRRLVVIGKQSLVVLLLLAIWYRFGLVRGLVVIVASVVMVLVVVDLVRFVRWQRARRADLIAAERPVPGIRKLWRIYRSERKRLAYLAKQWPVACMSQGLTGPSRAVPALFKVTPTLDNAVTAEISSGRMGVTPEDISTKADRIAQVVGCQAVTVKERETSPGCADIAFTWTNALGPVLPLSKLPPSAPGTLAYGKRADGSAATIWQHMSVLIVGFTRHGKSVICKSMVADIRRKNVPVDLYVGDTKDGVELVEWSRYIGKRVGSIRVARYETTPEGVEDMFREMVEVKRARGIEMRKKGLVPGQVGVKQHKPTLAEPLLIGWVDEALVLSDLLKQGTKGTLGEIGSQGAAMGCALWLNAQIGHAAVLGLLRELIPQRIAVATPTTDVTDTVLGKGAAVGGAACHKLEGRPGLGWSSASDSKPQPFRATLVTDEEGEGLAENKIPTMPPPFPVVAPPVEPVEKVALKVRLRALVVAFRARLAALAAAAVARVKSSLIGTAVTLDGFLATVGWAPRPHITRTLEARANDRWAGLAMLTLMAAAPAVAVVAELTGVAS